jgi:hypothetical protein
MSANRVGRMRRDTSAMRTAAAITSGKMQAIEDAKSFVGGNFFLKKRGADEL